MNNVEEIVFILKCIDLTNRDMAPRASNKKETYLYKYQSQTYFPIVTSSKNVLAENHMIIELSNESELETIKRVLGETTMKWENKYGETQNRLGVLYPIKNQISNYYILYYEPSLLGHEFIERLGNDLNSRTNTIKSILIESSSKQGLN